MQFQALYQQLLRPLSTVGRIRPGPSPNHGTVRNDIGPNPSVGTVPRQPFHPPKQIFRPVGSIVLLGLGPTVEGGIVADNVGLDPIGPLGILSDALHVVQYPFGLPRIPDVGVGVQDGGVTDGVGHDLRAVGAVVPTLHPAQDGGGLGCVGGGGGVAPFAIGGGRGQDGVNVQKGVVGNGIRWGRGWKLPLVVGCSVRIFITSTPIFHHLHRSNVLVQLGQSLLVGVASRIRPQIRVVAQNVRPDDGRCARTCIPTRIVAGGNGACVVCSLCLDQNLLHGGQDVVGRQGCRFQRSRWSNGGVDCPRKLHLCALVRISIRCRR
mmetsp:Transcript_13695/g.39274  ORF Transcript_13695/g.39274 Transcript_13695/m.39274 type:complete len:322 (-) Transcript_13695:499-1464(-)